MRNRQLLLINTKYRFNIFLTDTVTYAQCCMYPFRAHYAEGNFMLLHVIFFFIWLLYASAVWSNEYLCASIGYQVITPTVSVGCNYLTLCFISASGTKVHKCQYESYAKSPLLFPYWTKLCFDNNRHEYCCTQNKIYTYFVPYRLRLLTILYISTVHTKVNVLDPLVKFAFQYSFWILLLKTSMLIYKYGYVRYIWGNVWVC